MSEKIHYTLQDLREMKDDTITVSIAGDVLGCTGHLLGWMCHNEPEKVQFPFICIRSKTIIPRLGFVAWMEGKTKTADVAASAGVL
jgi:hypothetical protein